MANSRMLKELQSLAPWTWDKKCDKHPPGLKALHDFERVEHLQSWSKPPPSAVKKAKGSKPRAIQETMENANPNVQPPISMKAMQQTPVISKKVRNTKPDPLGLGVPLSPDHSEDTNSFGDSQAAAAPAITPGISLVTPQSEIAKQSVKASVMPRRLSMGMETPVTGMKRKHLAIDPPQKIQPTSQVGTELQQSLKKSQITEPVPRQPNQSTSREPSTETTRNERKKEQRMSEDSQAGKSEARKKTQTSKLDANLSNPAPKQRDAQSRPVTTADPVSKKAKVTPASVPNAGSGRIHEPSQRVFTTPKPASQPGPKGMKHQGGEEVKEPKRANNISRAPPAMWTDKPREATASMPTVASRQPIAVSSSSAAATAPGAKPRAEPRPERNQAAPQDIAGEWKAHTTATLPEREQLGSVAGEDVLPSEVAVVDGRGPQRSGGSDSSLEARQEAASALAAMSQQVGPGHPLTSSTDHPTASKATRGTLSSASLPPKAPFSDLTNRPMPSDSLKLLRQMGSSSIVSSSMPLVTPKSIKRDRTGSAMARAFEMLREIDSRQGWFY